MLWKKPKCPKFASQTPETHKYKINPNLNDRLTKRLSQFQWMLSDHSLQWRRILNFIIESKRWKVSQREWKRRQSEDSYSAQQCPAWVQQSSDDSRGRFLQETRNPKINRQKTVSEWLWLSENQSHSEKTHTDKGMYKTMSGNHLTSLTSLPRTYSDWPHICGSFPCTTRSWLLGFLYSNSTWEQLTITWCFKTISTKYPGTQ